MTLILRQALLDSLVMKETSISGTIRTAVKSERHRKRRSKPTHALGLTHILLQAPSFRDQDSIEKLPNSVIEKVPSRSGIASTPGSPMNITHCLGIDIADKTFTATLYELTSKTYHKAQSWPQSSEGFEALHLYLQEHQAHPDQLAIVLEATGVYSEQLSYFLAARGYRIAIEAPHKTKRAFHPLGAKTDSLDSRQLAEYAYRFLDQLPWWNPAPTLVEQIRVLLTTRDQLTQQKVAGSNTLHTLSYKVVRTPLAEAILQQTIAHLKEQIRKIDAEIGQRLNNNSDFGPYIALLYSVPGVGLSLAAQILVLTKGFSIPLRARSLAAHIGVCPLHRQSGSSLNAKPRSRRSGPPRLRKLLYLAAMSLRTHSPEFRQYFLRKLQEGKAKRLILNNIINRLLRILCAVIRDRRPYAQNYRSLHPRFSSI